MLQQFSGLRVVADIYDLMQWLGAFYVVHQQMPIFVIPVQGDGSCFYNSLAVFLRIYEIDIEPLFKDACGGIMGCAFLPGIIACCKAWYNEVDLSDAMKLRMIAAWYIMQNAIEFAGTWVGLSPEQCICEDILEPFSHADR